MNPYQIIAQQKKALEKKRRELKDCQTLVKAIEKELAWEKTRRIKNET
jgi:hypothetical protein